MLCERCKQNEATIVLTEIIGGVRTQHHLCNKCAAETEWGQLLDSDFSFGKLLSGILGMQNELVNKQETDEYTQIVCPICGTTYRDFLSNSQFGCSACYRTFGILMGSTIKKLQGSTAHAGKRPKYQGDNRVAMEVHHEQRETESVDEKISLLKSRLQEALAEEEYEEAAKYRDAIRALQEGRGIDA